MGVPALFRWLSQKYPKIISPVLEEQPRVIEGQEVPVNISDPNPNGEEMDNLYLDMNGIVHPCSHPEDRPPPATEEEMMLEVFKYTERVVNMVRPRKLLMIAVGMSISSALQGIRITLPSIFTCFMSLISSCGALWRRVDSLLGRTELITWIVRWRRSKSEDESATVTTLSFGPRGERERCRQGRVNEDAQVKD